MLGVFAAWWLWLALWADLEKMTAPLTPTDRQALRKDEEFGVGVRQERASSLIGADQRKCSELEEGMIMSDEGFAFQEATNNYRFKSVIFSGSTKKLRRPCGFRLRSRAL
jgi:hypothetical protein